ncbi:hypothetical protein [Streptomyces thioluteus]|uniref:hypothetical protein n=1 Tax=Streptomyces thioluteus TaxID=66431 RepID=UPI0031ED5E4E
MAYVVSAGTNLAYERLNERHLAASPCPSSTCVTSQQHPPGRGGGLLTGNRQGRPEGAVRRAGRTWRPAGTTRPGATAVQRELLALAGEILGGTAPRLGDAGSPAAATRSRPCDSASKYVVRWARDLPQNLVLDADFARLAEEIEAGGAHGVYPTLARPHPRAHRAPPPTSSSVSGSSSSALRTPRLQRRTGPSASTAPWTPPHCAKPSAGSWSATRRCAPASRTGPEGLLQAVGAPYDPWTDPGQEDGEWREAAGRFFADALRPGGAAHAADPLDAIGRRRWATCCCTCHHIGRRRLVVERPLRRNSPPITRHW